MMIGALRGNWRKGKQTRMLQEPWPLAGQAGRHATEAMRIGLWCLLAGLLFAPAAAVGSPGEAGKQAGARMATVAEPQESLDRVVLVERVEALEKENLVLREDLGKARLDTRMQFEEAAERLSDASDRFQQKIDELQAELAAERAARARKERNLWLAVGVLALAIVASD